MTSWLYFSISYPRKNKENAKDIIYGNKKDKLDCIFNEEDFPNQIYYYKKIFKADKSLGTGKNKTNYHFEFEIGDEKYIISFDSKGSTFIYDVVLETGKRILDIRRKIDQNIVEYNEKMDNFIEALKKSREESKIDELYKDTINLYTKKKGFSFLISLFLKIYKDKKELCNELMEKFYEMNINKNKKKDNEKNLDRKSYLGEDKYKSEFETIKSEADNLIKNNNYNAIQFYGIILSYLNYYNYSNFSEIINELFIERPEDLYEILLIYNSHIINPINQNMNFYNKFIKYSISNKEFSIFENGLNYIRDIETFIYVIDNNKKEIYDKYKKTDSSNKHIVKLDNNLKLKINEKKNIEIDGSKDYKDKRIRKPKSIKKNEPENVENNNSIALASNNEKSINEINIHEKNEISENNTTRNGDITIFQIIENINSIIEFSKDNNTFFIYFTNNFWKFILNYYNEPSQANIEICFNLRLAFMKYFELVNEIFKDKPNRFTIKKDANNYKSTDEFAFLLDQIIRKHINNKNKDISNIEKLGFITKYNPYYIEPNINKVNLNIFDLFNLNEIDKEFIIDFRRMNFEIIFKENISEYINKIMSKIEDIDNLEKIIRLINIKNITDKNIFLDSLKKIYDSKIRDEIVLLTGQKLNEAVKVVAEIAIINYIHENEQKKLNFIINRIKKLDKDIVPLILIEIMKICINKEAKKNEANEEEGIEIEEEEEEYKYINYKNIKDFIFKEFAKKVENENDIDNIIKFIDCLEGKDKNNDKKTDNKYNNKEDNIIKNNENINDFLDELMKNNIFTKDEFFSSNKNLKIDLLIKLYKADKIQNNDTEYYHNIDELINRIKEDLEGDILKKKLDAFLINDESFKKERLERLGLIKFIISKFDPNEEYEKIKKKNDAINKEIEKIKYIKDNIIIYYRETYQKLIQNIINIIRDNQNKKISDFSKENDIKDLIRDSNTLKPMADDIVKVKNFLLFNTIYDMIAGRDEDDKFKKAFKILENIGNDIKKKDTKTDKLYKD